MKTLREILRARDGERGRDREGEGGRREARSE